MGERPLISTIFEILDTLVRTWKNNPWDQCWSKFNFFLSGFMISNLIFTYGQKFVKSTYHTTKNPFSDKKKIREINVGQKTVPESQQHQKLNFKNPSSSLLKIRESRKVIMRTWIFDAHVFTSHQNIEFLSCSGFSIDVKRDSSRGKQGFLCTHVMLKLWNWASIERWCFPGWLPQILC